MKKIKYLLLLVSLITSNTFLCSCNDYESFNYEKYYESVFELFCSSDGRFDSIGTGFKCDNFIVTNAHVITYRDELEYTSYENIWACRDGAKLFRLYTVSFDKIKDIAILGITNPDKNYDKTPDLNLTTDYALGQDVFSIGNINGYGLSLGVGIISAKEKIYTDKDIQNRYIQSNIVIAKGSSGCPVLNYDGEVIGMMTFKLRDSDGEYIDAMSFLIPSKTIKEFIALNNVQSINKFTAL